MTTDPPHLLVHCDWGTAHNKRWMAKAFLSGGRYFVSAPEPVGNLSSLVERINLKRGTQQAALVGFDFPIGLPRLYAANAGVDNFASFLENLGESDAKDFYEICNHPDEISIHRPFYPYNFTPKGTKKRQHLLDGLKLEEFGDLLRRCELSQQGQNIPAAGPLFWTLGAKAPGRGAIRGWRDVIAPALRRQQIKLWPFHGVLDDLLHPGSTVVAETYPTQYHSWIVGRQISGKGNLEIRKAQASRFQAWARETSITLSPALDTAIHRGFIDGKDDALDAVIGLFGMIEVALGLRPEGRHPDPALSEIEGWILGQPVS